MFALRGVTLSLSVFAVVYCVMSLGIVLTWGGLHRRVQGFLVQRLGNVLFTIRLLPLLLASLMTAAFAIPSFLLLEPRGIDEPMGGVPVALACLGTALVLWGFASAVLTLLRAWRTVLRWSKSAEPIPSAARFPVLRIRRSVPPLTAAGIFLPKILLSGSAEFVLNDNELRAGLKHELAHIRRRDNLRKLLLRFVAFPAMQGLDAAWIEASEMAADDDAVSSTSDALDLAAALIKLSKLKWDESSPEVSAAMVQGHASLINTRIERLISWSAHPAVSSKFFTARLLALLVPTLAGLAICYGSLLADVHNATEWLFR
jgi:Zn-dependent protease with chaperone function